MASLPAAVLAVVAKKTFSGLERFFAEENCVLAALTEMPDQNLGSVS
jgi:hypothetical protein